jgi:hypothetical protein
MILIGPVEIVPVLSTGLEVWSDVDCVFHPCVLFILFFFQPPPKMHESLISSRRPKLAGVLEFSILVILWCVPPEFLLLPNYGIAIFP